MIYTYGTPVSEFPPELRARMRRAIIRNVSDFYVTPDGNPPVMVRNLPPAVKKRFVDELMDNPIREQPGLILEYWIGLANRMEGRN